jgi:hypothetical protein
MLEDLKELRRILDRFISKYERQGFCHEDDEKLKETGQQLLKKGESFNDDEQERWSRFDRWDGNDIY